MAKYSQSKSDRIDESLGMRRGAERNYSQSYKSRRDESMGSRGGGMELADNTQASTVKSIPSDSEQYDLGRVKPYVCGSMGYPSEALKNSI